jgi:hypothetical protein
VKTRVAGTRSIAFALPAALETELRRSAPEVLEGPLDAAFHYAQLATASANGLGLDVALRIAAAATLMETALLAHSTAPRLSSEGLLRADFHLALAAEILAEVGPPAMQDALARAAMELMAGMGSAPEGLPSAPRARLGAALVDGFHAGGPAR